MATYRTLVHATGPGFSSPPSSPGCPPPWPRSASSPSLPPSPVASPSPGAVAAGYGAGAAIGGPVVGALADRFGQRLIGLVAAVVDAAALAGVYSRSHNPVLAAVARRPPVSRHRRSVHSYGSRWAVLLGDRGQNRMLPTAFSYEGAVDELSYLVGPAFVGVVALTGPPGLPCSSPPP